MNFKKFLRKIGKKRGEKFVERNVFALGKVSTTTLGYGQYGWEGVNDNRPHACFKKLNNNN